MGLNIKNAEVERLVAEVARMTGESKTEAVRQALLMRKRAIRDLSPEERSARLRKYLETEVWPKLPPGVRGKTTTKAEREEILGIGEHGYCE